jgi:Zn-dependent protease with chaperone function
MPFQADFFDGLSARSSPVSVRVEEDLLRFESDGRGYAYTLGSVHLQAKLGSGKRLIDLPDGGRLESFEIAELESAMPGKQHAFWRTVHYLESHLGWVMVALLLTVATGWGFLQYGVPALAERVANATPPSVEAKLGDEVIQSLDTKFSYFSPSKIDKSRQDSVKLALQQMCTKFKNCPEYRLEFRNSPMIGPNAFAMPGGVVVITDDLIHLSKNNTEIVAVLAHELGHVKKRHAFRQGMQGVISGLILAAVTGDVSSMASGLPGVLMQLHYTRELENEADGFALQALQASCLPPKAFADILLRLSQAYSVKHGKKDEGEDAPVSEMLSSHPDTIERVKPFLTVKSACAS